MKELLSVEEATSEVYSSLEEFTGWKYSKSQRCLKKKVVDLELAIRFSTSKWNRSHEYVGINAVCHVICKKLGKLPVQNVVADFGYHPTEGSDLYWFDISTKEKLMAVIEILKHAIQTTALELADHLEKDYNGAVSEMLEYHFEEWNVRLEYIANVLGTDAIVPKVHSIVESLTDEQKQEIEDYKNGKRTKTWMLNPTNLKYIIDNGLSC